MAILPPFRRHTAAWFAGFAPVEDPGMVVLVFVEIVRAPLLGNPIPGTSFAFVTAMTAGGFLCAIAMLMRYRSRVPYWL